MFRMALFDVCIVVSMLDVCAIPGVTMACAAKLEHTSINVNWVVSLLWLIMLFMTSAGVIDADYAPNFLINYECMRDTKEYDKTFAEQDLKDRQQDRQQTWELQTDGGKIISGYDEECKRFGNDSYEDRYRNGKDSNM